MEEKNKDDLLEEKDIIELNERYNKIVEEREERKRKEDLEGKEETKETADSIKDNTPEETKQDNSNKEMKPPIVVIPKQDIVKKKKSLEYLIGSKDSIKRTVDTCANQKLKWTKEEISLMSRVRAISKELETITNRLKIVIQQQEGYEEITCQLAEHPVADIKIECLESGEFSVVTADTEVTIIKGSKDEVKGFLKGRYSK